MICHANFAHEVLLADTPVLLLCMPRNESFSEQAEIIDFVSSNYGDDIKAYVVAEEFINQFCREYDVKGTPIFLLFSGGIEVERILGCIDRQTVSKYLSRYVYR